MTSTALPGGADTTALSQHDAEEFTEAVASVVSGGWRLSLQAWRLGVPQALGMSHQEWVNEKLGGYVRLAIPDRREIVAELAEQGLSTREIGDVLGVGNATVSRDLAVPDETTAYEDPPLPAELDVEAVPDETPDESEPDQMSVHYSSATDDWATPQDLFNRLDAEFTFDLDVCASDENAKCTLYFTKEVDGLSQEWTGTCWMNPPYGDEIVAWVAKAYESAKKGATVVCLVPARTDTRWFWDFCRHGEVRLLRGRLKFGGGDTSAPFPSAVVIFGREPRVVWWERS